MNYLFVAYIFHALYVCNKKDQLTDIYTSEFMAKFQNLHVFIYFLNFCTLSLTFGSTITDIIYKVYNHLP